MLILTLFFSYNILAMGKNKGEFMKKVLLFFAMFCITLSANADTILVESNLNMDNFWNKNGKEAEKVISVARKLIHDNELRRAPIMVEKTWRAVNASTNTYTKSILVSTSILPYIDNDDELAFVVGHELAHAQEAYGGALKLISMSYNSKKYEYKSDLKAIDYMVKSGYNPIAGIIVGDKIFDEPLWDWGFTYTHPKGSKRLMEMYEYIYKKYPSYLSSSMANNVVFVDFVKQNQKEISSFQQKQAKKKKKAEIL